MRLLLHLIYTIMAYLHCSVGLAVNLSAVNLEPLPRVDAVPGEFFNGTIRVQSNKRFKDIWQSNMRLEAIESELIEQAVDGAFSSSSLFLIPVTWKLPPTTVAKLKSLKHKRILAELQTATVTVFVASDYFALRKEDNSLLYVPLTLSGARMLAESIDFELPTPFLVRKVHEDAKTKLRTVFMPPGPKMTRLHYTLEHSDKLRSQMSGRKTALMDLKLRSGHKKDVVISAQKNNLPGKLAIYGWIKEGKPVQPLSTYHHSNYVDYSHGIRMVWPYIKIGDRFYSYRKLLRHPQLSLLLSRFGPITPSQFMRSEGESG